jgi:class 3 adenylate cyclase/pimeloyl-ACP methyl ester carboxylesterase
MPKVRYAQSADGTYIAFQVFGEGPDLLVAFPWISHLELFWEDPDVGTWLRSLARFARVITLDQRGIGLSDRMTQVIDLETKVDDVRAVLDAAGSERATLYGQGVDGGAICAMFAATFPERTIGVVFWSGQASGGVQPDDPWGYSPGEAEAFLTMIADTWGDESTVAPLLREAGAKGQADDPAIVRRWAKIMRNAASRGDALAHQRVFDETDFRSILPAIHVPALVLAPAWDDDSTEAEWMAAQIPGSTFALLPHQEEFPPYWGQTEANLRAVRQFIEGLHSVEQELDRVLATVLFTDIVDSTATAAVMGDAKWRALIGEHDKLARSMVSRFRGTFVRGTGDGMLATFDGPARAVRCAEAFVEAIKPHGVEIRAGCHTGEITFGGNDLAGLGVHVAARVAAMAGTSEVWTSSTVKDLTAGSGLSFEDAGEHELKGVPDRWRLYRVMPS